MKKHWDEAEDGKEREKRKIAPTRARLSRERVRQSFPIYRVHLYFLARPERAICLPRRWITNARPLQRALRVLYTRSVDAVPFDRSMVTNDP